MERIWRATVEEEQTAGSFLAGSMGLTKKQIRQAKFRTDGICVNGVRRRINHMLYPGDEITVKLEASEKISDHLIPAEGELDILWEDEDLLVVNKPAGMVVHPSGAHYQDSLANIVAAYAKRKGEKLCIRSVGRLDRETSGILVFAKNQVAAARLSLQREQGIFRKTYLAFTEGYPESETGTICAKIREKPGSFGKMEVTEEEGKPAITHYQVKERGSGFSVLEVKIETGRTHQIRVHMAFMGHPLLGDRLYGTASEKIQRTALHAWKTEFIHPFSGERLYLEAQLPEDMKKWAHL